MTDQDPPTYTLHPLYPFRRLLIINAVIGFILSVLASIATTRYTQPVWVLGIFGMIASGGLSLLDLAIFQCRSKTSENNHDDGENGHTKTTTAARCPQCRLPVQFFHHNDLHLTGETSAFQQRSLEKKEPQPIWPVKWIMILDLLILLAMFWTWCAELGALTTEYYYGSTALLAYATMPVLVALPVHYRCFWKAFRERERQKWKKQQEEEEQECIAAGTNVYANTHLGVRCSWRTSNLKPGIKPAATATVSPTPVFVTNANCPKCCHANTIKIPRNYGTSTIGPGKQGEGEECDNKFNVQPHCNTNLPTAACTKLCSVNMAGTETDLVTLDVPPPLPLLTPSETQETELSFDAGDRESRAGPSTFVNTFASASSDDLESIRVLGTRTGVVQNRDSDDYDGNDEPITVVKKKMKGKKKEAS